MIAPDRSRTLPGVGEQADITRHDDFDPDDAELFGVRLPETIAIVEYDPSWPALYATVAARLRDALGDRVLELDHVGSTSVPGLAAKPVIDVSLTVADSADEPAYLPDLEAAGFELRVREPGWHEHRCLRGTDPPTNVHVWSPGATEPIRNALFRDWLRDHPDDRELYVAAKRSAAAASNDAGETMMEYNLRKQAVIREILDRIFRAEGLLS